MRTSAEIKSEIIEKFGFFPPFFEPAIESPIVLENLWQQTLSAYVENPIPALFKEKLAALLARYCTVPYCLMCHSSTLRPLGMTSKDILKLLDMPAITLQELSDKTKCLTEHGPHKERWPESGSEVEECILYCCIAIFLNQDSEHCLKNLRILLGNESYSYLILFLAYNRTCLQWAEAHPELSAEADYRVQKNMGSLLKEEPALITFFQNYHGKMRDQIGERRKVEQAKVAFETERKNWLRLFENSTGFATMIAMPSFMYEYSNPAHDKIFGRSPVGKSFGDFATEEAGTQVQDLLQRVYDSGNPEVILEVPVSIMGETRYFDANYVARKDALGKVDGVVAWGIDITEQVKAREEALRANETKSSFLANMSHEIRTPLGAIIGFSEMLRDQTVDSDERRSFIEVINRNAKALTRVIDDILDLSKVEAGKLDIELTPMSLREILQDVMALFSDRVKATGVALNLHLPSDFPEKIESDTVRVRQILINIIGNAVKFTEKGSVDVFAEVSDLYKEQKNFKILVKDTGRGLSEEQRAKLFQPFSQADNTTTREFGGTGLGLVLSRRLAKALGGNVEITECGTGKGCTFAITFVARLAEPKTESTAAEPQRVQRAQPLQDLRILLAEDSLDNQELIQRVLQRSGATVVLADNGSQAVNRALEGKFDLVLMDIQMPTMDGYEAIKKLNEANYKSPVIALTAHAMEEERNRTKEAGFTAHVTKPIEFPVLIQTIADVVKKI